MLTRNPFRWAAALIVLLVTSPAFGIECESEVARSPEIIVNFG